MFDPQLVAAFAQQETPFYYYDLDLLQQTLEAASAAASAHNFHVHYALKANFNQRVLEAIRDMGFGADCVSGNEVKRAVDIGFAPSKIVFAGVGKSDKEINLALEHDIFAFNVESISELEIIDRLAAATGSAARVALRINPNVDAHTHHYITTGLDENKFGIAQWELGEAVETLRRCPNITLVGIHFHIGSQITDLNVFKSLCVKVNELNYWFGDRGFRLPVLNVGGGLGVDYYHPDEHPIPDFQGYFNVFSECLERFPGQEVHFELGRALVSQCSALISRVLYVKHGIKKNFLILDAGMTELMRPALYQAYHRIERLGHHNGLESGERLHYDVVGPICESTDCFGKEVELPKALRGDLIAIRTTGAYGEVMASHYNLRDEIRYVYSDQISR